MLSFSRAWRLLTLLLHSLASRNSKKWGGFLGTMFGSKAKASKAAPADATSGNDDEAKGPSDVRRSFESSRNPPPDALE
jgi:hypothetical protein